MKVKRRIFSGCVCEQYVYTVPDNTKNLRTAEPRVRFKTDEERETHRLLQSKRHHARIVNATFNPQSLYSTLTLDDDHEVHTFEEARRLRDNYVRRLKYAAPDAQIMIYMGRGKGSDRIHFHMLSNGLDEKTIENKWTAGEATHIRHLREHNFYNGEDYGRDYTGLADYLFGHWKPEQGGHRWKQTKNIVQPDKSEPPAVVKRAYSEAKPPRPPAGYKLVKTEGNEYGYLYFKYVKIPSNIKPPKRC